MVKSLIRKVIICLIFITMTVGCNSFTIYAILEVEILDWERKPSSVYIWYKITNIDGNTFEAVSVYFLIEIENASYLIAKDYFEEQIQEQRTVQREFEYTVESDLNVISVTFDDYNIEKYGAFAGCFPNQF